MRVIIASKKDVAAMNIKKLLIENYGFRESKNIFDGNTVYLSGDIQLVTINRDSVYAEHLDSKLNPDLYIFASKHKSESGFPCLSAHSTGNFSDNALGGNKRELAFAPSKAISGILKKLNETRTKGFDVALEVTHHGPTGLKKPLVFAEVGSTEKQWNDMDACRAVADAIMTFEPDGRSAIGFGGPHYAPKFTKLALDGWAIGHICPKYQLASLDEEMFRQMVEKTVPRPVASLVDKKGTKGWLKNMVKELSKDLNLDVEMV